MKGFRINPDKKYVDIIVQGLLKKDGHCPCRLNVDDTTLCPCDEFVKDGICKCKLYLPLQDVDKDTEEVTEHKSKSKEDK